LAKRTGIPKNEFLTAVKLTLYLTFFTFNHKIYRQKFDTPMDFPLSPVIANLVMKVLENRALKNLGIDIDVQA